MNTVIRIFFLIGFLVTLPAYANTEPANGIGSLLQQAQQKQLAQAPYWLALGHYLPASNASGFQSEVTSRSFFLSPQGANSPQQELDATLRALFLPAKDKPDEHAQCRFIARFHWLRKQLNLDAFALPQIQCLTFLKWSADGQGNTLSLVFATGYLDNPASFYGHLLLKFNSEKNAQRNELLDQSLNYGANIPNDENPLVYVFRGLFGGYGANFSADQFYRHNLVYGENELRDLWVYDLALSADEVQQITHHSWELLNNTFTYYFLKENCAYRMAELLELVIQQPLLPQDLPWSMPATVFNNLVRIEHRGQPLVSKVRLIPSRQNRFYDKYYSLNETQQKVFYSVTKDGLNLSQPAYQALQDKNKVVIVDTLFDYYAFRSTQADDKKKFEPLKRKLLIERAGLPAGATIQPEHALRLSPPHLGPLPGLVRTGMVYSDALGSGLELRFRPAYYDNLGIDAGRLPDSHLAMFDVRAIYRDEQLSLRSLDFVNVQTLNVSRTSLTGDGSFAWSIRAGLVNQDLSCDDCNVFRLSTGGGKAISLARYTTVYGMFEGLAQTQYQRSGNFGVVAKIGLWAAPWKNWKTHFMIGTRKYLDGEEQQARLIRWENRFGSNRNWDVRLRYEKQVESEVSAAVSLYW